MRTPNPAYPCPQSFRGLIRIPVTLFLMLALAGLGCRTMKVPNCEVGEDHEYLFTAETNGLVVAVEPITQEDQLKECFKVNLVEKGIVPILIVVDNQSPKSFLLDKSKVYVLEAKSEVPTESGQATLPRGSGAENAALAGAALMGVAIVAAPAAMVVAAPLILGSMKSMSNADVIRHNLAKKSLSSHTVEPRQKADGYLYFQLPKDKKFTGGHQVVVELIETDSGQPLTYVFRVN